MIRRKQKAPTADSAQESPETQPAQESPHGRPGPAVRALRARVDALEAGVADSDVQLEITRLEDEVQELRGLGGRVAELTDLVTELIAYQANKQDPEFRKIVARYLDGV